MTWVSTEVCDSRSAMMTTVSSGRSTCSRSTIGRTSRMSIRRLSIQMSPLGRTAMRMLPLSLSSAVNASSLLTVMPASLMKDVVMMKKISRFRTKSSIGARSMPVSSDSSSECRRASNVNPPLGDFGGGDGNVLHTALPDLVDDLHQDAGHRSLLRHDDYGIVRTLR